jgi:hypothetical protein
MLVFRRQHPVTARDLWILPLEGKVDPRPYLRGPSDEHSPAVSPDGRWLAYVSNESGQDEVYLRAFPTPGMPVQVTSEGGWGPRWAPNGRELFYRSAQGMVAATVTASTSLKVGGRTVLFDDRPYLSHAYGPAYDVHPDGQRFLMIRRGTEQDQVIVVLNWFDNMKQGRLTGSDP